MVMLIAGRFLHQHRRHPIRLDLVLRTILSGWRECGVEPDDRSLRAEPPPSVLNSSVNVSSEHLPATEDWASIPVATRNNGKTRGIVNRTRS